MLTKKVFLMGLMTLLVFAIGSMSNHFAQASPAGETMGLQDFSGSYDGEFSGTASGMLTAILVQDEDQLTGHIAVDFSGGAIRLSRLEATVEGSEFVGEAMALDGSGTRTVLFGELDTESKAITGYFLASTGEVADFYIMDKLEAQEPLDLNGRYAGRGYNAPDGAQFTLTIAMQHAEARLTGNVTAQTPIGPLTGELRAILDGNHLRDQVTILSTPIGPATVMSPNSFVTSDGNIIMSDINAGKPIPLRGSFVIRRQ
jgi:hypothetical protein